MSLQRVKQLRYGLTTRADTRKCYWTALYTVCIRRGVLQAIEAQAVSTDAKQSNNAQIPSHSSYRTTEPVALETAVSESAQLAEGM
eukprot:1339528-Amphidinium_carterae.1